MVSRKNRTKRFTNYKVLTWSILILIILIITVCTLSLQQYLYRIQINERISKVDNYEDFVLTIHPQKRSTKTYQFEHKKTHFYFEGIEQVYINYGTTKIFFEEAIKKGLITIQNVINNCVLEQEEENYKRYYHTSTDNSKNYYITIIEEDLTTVIFSK